MEEMNITETQIKLSDRCRFCLDKFDSTTPRIRIDAILLEQIEYFAGVGFVSITHSTASSAFYFLSIAVQSITTFTGRNLH